MRIVLDTDVITRSPDLGSASFNVLRDYLGKTDARVILAEIVFDELKANRRRIVQDRTLEANAALKRLSKVLLASEVRSARIDASSEVEAYSECVLKGLGVTLDDIVPYKDSYLRDIVGRALSRTKPCSSKGEEFRDAILWNTVKDLARAQPDDSVVFISCNTSDFADAHGALHADLAAEIEGDGLLITYYASLEAFNKERSVRISFITEEWLEEHLVGDDLIEAATPEIDPIITSYLERPTCLPTQSRVTGVSVSQNTMCVVDYYVNQMQDGTHVVHASLEGDIVVRFRFLRPGGRPGQISLEGGGFLERDIDLVDLMRLQQSAGETRVAAVLRISAAVQDQSVRDLRVEDAELDVPCSVRWRDI